MVRSYEVIGKAIPRVDGPAKVTGQATYAADVKLPGVLWGKCLYSPHAHARIVSIDTSAARALPGVHAVITGADVTSNRFGRTLRDVPVLAKDEVLHAGERVAAVAADDEDIAQRAIDLIEVEYEPLPAVFDALAALEPGAPILHPNFNTYIGVRDPLPEPSNAYLRSSFEKGDLEKGFADAEVIVENTFRTQTNHGGAMETTSVLVWDDRAAGRVRVWASNKVPYRVKEPYAYSFEVPEEDVVFLPTYVGGDFGSKTSPPTLPVAYQLSRASGRPVRMIQDYVEELLHGNPNQTMVYRLKSGVKRDGTITAHQIEHFVNCGAYAGYKPGGAIGGSNQAGGPYKIENVKVSSANVYTNSLPGQIFRSPGEPQAAFAIESHIDELAAAIGMDPVAFRLHNLVETGDEMAAGERLQDVRAKETLNTAVEVAGFRAPKAAMIGRGVAIAERSQGGGQANVAITLRPDGTVLIGTPLFDQGTGSHTTLAQVTAEELGLSMDQIEIELWDTDSVKFDAGLGGSIQSRLSSTVAFEGTQAVKREIVSFVARQMGWPEEKLSLRGGDVWRTDIEESVNWWQLIRSSGESITGRGEINENVRHPFTSFATQIAEVSVDPETGEIKLLKLTTVHDTGQVLNRIGHQGQINGGVVQGIGFGMMEELKVEEGRVITGSLGDYKLPTTMDIPQLTTVLLESQTGAGPFAVKAIGELPTVPTAAAIANAIKDAVGVRIRDLPATSEKVYRALQG
ncbi:MAG TPA: xanthine dehydrogenase family protein molybdopterin-binding subunit [Dehalococcoidia bacterium]|nr:xanthine dehydrogenase family protein molybdopterin-binding subunit [Dehalococcoidia bacterium]